MRDAPQSISIIPREVIEQQSASTLRDVLRNVSGISMAAGEGGGGPAGDNLTLRGFGARNDIFVDGIRDFASYTRDTFNVEQVEVVKGPSSAQTGRGSTGGYINLFSKQPKLATFVGGTARRRRARTSCARRPTSTSAAMPSALAAARRCASTLLYHDADTPGRDYVDTKRWGIAPSVAVGLGTSTRAILSYYRLRAGQCSRTTASRSCRRPTPALPPNIADQPAPVDYDNYYGLLERDHEDTVANIATFALEHDLTDALRISNTTRYGYATRDSIYSAPRFVANNSTHDHPADPVARHGRRDPAQPVQPLRQVRHRQVRHDLIAGFEFAARTSRNQLRTVTGRHADRPVRSRSEPAVGRHDRRHPGRHRPRQGRHRRRLPVRHGSLQRAIAGHRRPALGALQERVHSGSVADHRQPGNDRAGGEDRQAT